MRFYGQTRELGEPPEIKVGRLGRARQPWFVPLRTTHAGNDVQQDTQQVGARPFVVTHIGGRSTGNVQINLRDTSANVNWMPRRVTLASLIGGVATEGKPLPIEPWMILPNGGVTLDALDTSGVANAVEVTLIGFLVEE